MVTILKLGGSVITEKTGTETVDRASLEACATALEAFDGDLVLVHGAGSFGHYHAERFGVTVTEGTNDAHEVFVIHDSMRALNDGVLGVLHDHGVDAVAIHPLSIAHRDREGGLSLPAAGLRTVLDLGFVPVLFGDVIPQTGEGFTVLSGDEIAVDLATQLGADRVGMCSVVPGVLDGSGELIPRITSLADAAGALGDSDGWDVTGGMAEKVRTLLELPTPASVFGVDDLPRFLAGEPVGTLIDVDDRPAADDG